MKKLALLAAIMSFAGCEDQPQEKSGGGEVQPTGGYQGSTGGGGGDVAIQPADGGKTTLVDHYQTALAKIRERDWDGAREALLEALHRSEGHDIQAQIQEHLKMVEQGILTQPTYTAPELFAGADKFYESKVSMRGKLLQPGAVGKVTYYFWLESGKKIQCRYDKLSLEDKKKILGLGDGAQVLVRGTLKSPWGTNPHPYMDLSYFRIEKLPPPPPEGKEGQKPPEETALPESPPPQAEAKP